MGTSLHETNVKYEISQY